MATILVSISMLIPIFFAWNYSLTLNEHFEVMMGQLQTNVYLMTEEVDTVAAGLLYVTGFIGAVRVPTQLESLKEVAEILNALDTDPIRAGMDMIGLLCDGDGDGAVDMILDNVPPAMMAELIGTALQTPAIRDAAMQAILNNANAESITSMMGRRMQLDTTPARNLQLELDASLLDTLTPVLLDYLTSMDISMLSGPTAITLLSAVLEPLTNVNFGSLIEGLASRAGGVTSLIDAETLGNIVDALRDNAEFAADNVEFANILGGFDLSSLDAATQFTILEGLGPEVLTELLEAADIDIVEELISSSYIGDILAGLPTESVVELFSSGALSLSPDDLGAEMLLTSVELMPDWEATVLELLTASDLDLEQMVTVENAETVFNLLDQDTLIQFIKDSGYEEVIMKELLAKFPDIFGDLSDDVFAASQDLPADKKKEYELSLLEKLGVDWLADQLATIVVSDADFQAFLDNPSLDDAAQQALLESMFSVLDQDELTTVFEALADSTAISPSDIVTFLLLQNSQFMLDANRPNYLAMAQLLTTDDLKQVLRGVNYTAVGEDQISGFMSTLDPSPEQQAYFAAYDIGYAPEWAMDVSTGLIEASVPSGAILTKLALEIFNAAANKEALTFTHNTDAEAAFDNYDPSVPPADDDAAMALFNGNNTALAVLIAANPPTFTMFSDSVDTGSDAFTSWLSASLAADLVSCTDQSPLLCWTNFLGEHWYDLSPEQQVLLLSNARQADLDIVMTGKQDVLPLDLNTFEQTEQVDMVQGSSPALLKRLLPFYFNKNYVSNKIENKDEELKDMLKLMTDGVVPDTIVDGGVALKLFVKADLQEMIHDYIADDYSFMAELFADLIKNSPADAINIGNSEQSVYYEILRAVDGGTTDTASELRVQTALDEATVDDRALEAAFFAACFSKAKREFENSGSACVGQNPFGSDTPTLKQITEHLESGAGTVNRPYGNDCNVRLTATEVFKELEAGIGLQSRVLEKLIRFFDPEPEVIMVTFLTDDPNDDIDSIRSALNQNLKRELLVRVESGAERRRQQRALASSGGDVLAASFYAGLTNPTTGPNMATDVTNTLIAEGFVDVFSENPELMPDAVVAAMMVEMVDQGRVAALNEVLLWTATNNMESLEADTQKKISADLTPTDTSQISSLTDTFVSTFASDPVALMGLLEDGLASGVFDSTLQEAVTGQLLTAAADAVSGNPAAQIEILAGLVTSAAGLEALDQMGVIADIEVELLTQETLESLSAEDIADLASLLGVTQNLDLSSLADNVAVPALASAIAGTMASDADFFNSVDFTDLGLDPADFLNALSLSDPNALLQIALSDPDLTGSLSELTSTFLADGNLDLLGADALLSLVGAMDPADLVNNFNGDYSALAAVVGDNLNPEDLIALGMDVFDDLGLDGVEVLSSQLSESASLMLSGSNQAGFGSDIFKRFQDDPALIGYVFQNVAGIMPIGDVVELLSGEVVSNVLDQVVNNNGLMEIAAQMGGQVLANGDFTAFMKDVVLGLPADVVDGLIQQVLTEVLLNDPTLITNLIASMSADQLKQLFKLLPSGLLSGYLQDLVCDAIGPEMDSLLNMEPGLLDIFEEMRGVIDLVADFPIADALEAVRTAKSTAVTVIPSIETLRSAIGDIKDNLSMGQNGVLIINLTKLTLLFVLLQVALITVALGAAGASGERVKLLAAAGKVALIALGCFCFAYGLEAPMRVVVDTSCQLLPEFTKPDADTSKLGKDIFIVNMFAKCEFEEMMAENGVDFGDKSIQELVGDMIQSMAAQVSMFEEFGADSVDGYKMPEVGQVDNPLDGLPGEASLVGDAAGLPMDNVATLVDALNNADAINEDLESIQMLLDVYKSVTAAVVARSYLFDILGCQVMQNTFIDLTTTICGQGPEDRSNSMLGTMEDLQAVEIAMGILLLVCIALSTLNSMVLSNPYKWWEAAATGRTFRFKICYTAHLAVLNNGQESKDDTKMLALPFQLKRLRLDIVAVDSVLHWLLIPEAFLMVVVFSPLQPKLVVMVLLCVVGVLTGLYGAHDHFTRKDRVAAQIVSLAMIATIFGMSAEQFSIAMNAQKIMECISEMGSGEEPCNFEEQSKYLETALFMFTIMLITGIMTVTSTCFQFIKGYLPQQNQKEMVNALAKGKAAQKREALKFTKKHPEEAAQMDADELNPEVSLNDQLSNMKTKILNPFNVLMAFSCCALLGLIIAIIVILVVDPPPKCNGRAEFCDLLYTDVTFPTSNDVTASMESSYLPPKNQYGLTGALSHGVKAFVVKLHYDAAADDFFTCGKHCDPGFGMESFADTLTILKDHFADTSSNGGSRDVLTLVVKSHSSGSLNGVSETKLLKYFETAGMKDEIFNFRVGGPQTLATLIEEQSRLVLFIKDDLSAASEDAAFLLDKSACWTNPRGFHDKEEFTCELPSEGAGGEKFCDKPLVFVNYYFNEELLVGDAGEGATNENFRGPIAVQILNQNITVGIEPCQRSKPNFLVVNFAELGNVVEDSVAFTLVDVEVGGNGFIAAGKVDEY